MEGNGKLVYLSGPISADTPEGMSENFFLIQEYTKKLILAGYLVVSPGLNSYVESFHDYHLENDALNWQIHLTHDIGLLARIPFDIIAVLPGWERSKGACVEVAAMKYFKDVEITPVENLVGGLDVEYKSSRVIPGIGVSGKAGSGKDTLAAMLKDKLPDHWRIAHFADAVKLDWFHNCALPGARLLNTTARERLAYVNHHKNKPHVRQKLIEIGMNVRRNDPNYWIKQLDYSVNPLIIPDVRFENELEFLADHGFILVRINALEGVRKSRGRMGNVSHPSETALDGRHEGYWNWIIENNGSDLDDLRIPVRGIAELANAKLSNPTDGDQSTGSVENADKQPGSCV